MMFKFIVFMLCVSSAIASEHTLDLNLSDKDLKHFSYTPKIQESERVSINLNGINRTYFVYFPKRIEPVMPVLVALHGAGRTGSSMIDTWRAIADKYKFIIIAPNGLNNNWNIGSDESEFISASIKDALSKRKIESGKLYLFGHSNGAKQAIAQAALHPDMFQRVAAHAGTLPVEINNFKDKERNKSVKVALFLGDRDHIFSIDSGRQTVSWLSSIGIETEFYILKDHSHWYYNDAHLINESVWTFLKQI